MPFTPFHIGHAVITYSIFDKLDFIALLYGSILVDIEPFLILFLNLPYPLHGPIHSIIGILAITPLIYIITLITKLILSKMGFSLRKNSRKIVIASILIGGYTHITLDAFLYSEMNLAWPFPYWNPLFGIFGYSEVYGFCIFSFLAGLLIYTARRTLFREKI